MSDRSFVRIGGLAGVFLALTAWLAVVEYYALVPVAQQTPLFGTRDAGAYVASLVTESRGLQIFNGLYALIAFWALVATVAAYYRLRANGEAWAFFGTFVGAFASAGTIVASVGDVAHIRYLATATVIVSLGEAPNAVNPLGVVNFALTGLWFLIAAALMWRGGFPRLLAALGVVAFADLLAGFIASLAGATSLATIAAIVAGAAGGPIFWLWLGVLLWRDSG